MAGMRAEEALALSKSYTEKTVIGMGAIKGDTGAPGRDGADGNDGQDGFSPIVTVTETTDGHNVSIKDANGAKEFEVLDGEKGADGADGKSAYQTWLDLGNTGTEEDFLLSLKGEKGADGTMNFEDLTEEQKESLNGFSPTITPNPDNTDDVYKLDITTKDGTFTTPNLRGGDEVTKYEYMGTGYLSGETYYTYEDLSTKIGETVEVTVSNRYGESQDTLTIISKISDTELEVDNGAWIATIMLTNTQTINAKLIDDARTSTDSTWSSTKIKDELDNVFDNLTEEQKESLKGEDGFSPIITENADNTDDVYKLDIETKDGILTTPNLKGQGGEVTGSTYLATGSIDMENETVTFNQTFEEIKTAYLEGKAILAEMLVEGEAKYIFNPLYVLGDAISFEWINSSAKLGVQINLMEDNSTALSVTSLEGSEGSEALDTLVITGNYSTDDDDNWTVSNIDKTFVEINEAITINRDVVLRLYPEGDTTNPYILYPTMHYANMGTAFSLMVSDTGQISGLSVMITADNQVIATRNEYDFDKLNESAEIIHTDLSGNLAGITTVLDLVNALLEEYRTERKNVRFECGSISNSTLTDLPQDYGYLTIKAGGTNILEVTFAYSNLGFKKMYYGFLNRTANETLYSSLDWEEVNTGVKADIPIIENGKDVVQHKITKNRSITELEAYTDPNGGTGYKIDDLYLTYDCEKLAKGFDDWLAEKGITPVKGTTYEDVAQIKVYSSSAGSYVYISTHIKFDNTAYLGYNIKYNDTDYVIISVKYDYDNGKTLTTFTGLNVFNIAKIIPELAGCYIQSDILDVLHNWFELYKPIGLEDSVGLYSKQEALLNQDLALNTSIDSKTVGPFDLGNIVSLMTSPLQKLLFSVDSEGKNLKIVANDEKNRTASLTNGLFSGNLLASKNTFATLNDMSTLPTPPDGALGIWTVVPDAAGQPESTNKGGTLIIAHITSMLYSQTINYVGTRIAIYVTQGAIYYALGYGGKYYPTSSWTPASGGPFRWYKISSTLV